MAMMKQTLPSIKRIGSFFAILLMLLFCAVLMGCTASAPENQQLNWPQSPYQDSDFDKTDILMEMALEVYGIDDENVAYVLFNSGANQVVFTDEFSLEYYTDEDWLTIPFAAEISQNSGYTLPGLQMCKIDVSISLFEAPLPEGQYRIVRKVNNALYKAEFAIAEERIGVFDMKFGHTPLMSLPADYDGIDAQNDGIYSIREDGVFNQEAVRFFADKVHLGVPAMLRTVMHTDEGAVLVRDIIFVPDPDGPGRFFVTLDDSRRTSGSEQLLTESVYSFMSIAQIGNKRKVCLSNFVSHIGDASEDTPYELISPDAADNIDLVATIELRVADNTEALPYLFLNYSPGGESYATISRGGLTFGYKTEGIVETDLRLEQEGSRFFDIQWTGDMQLLLSGNTSDGEFFQYTCEIYSEHSDSN